MNQVLAAAIGSAADIAVLLVARLAYLRYRRKRHRKARSEVFARYGMRIEIPPADAAFREYLKKWIRTHGGPPKPTDG